MNIFATRAYGVLALLAILLVGCGGGSGSSDTTSITDGTGGGTSTIPSFTLKNQGLGGFIRTIIPVNDGSGDIYVGGGFTTHNSTAVGRIIRLNSDNTVDTSFNAGTGFDSHVQVIAPANDGSGDIYVGGWFASYNGTSSNRIIRLKSDGTVNTAFAVGSGFDSTVYAISPANDGSDDIYVGGSFTNHNGTGSNYIIRLKSDGTVNTAFAVGTGFNTTVNAIATANDGSGDIYVGGNFTSYNGTASNRIIRLKSDGTVNTAFVVGGGFSGTVSTIASATGSSGDIYVGGNFSSYNGTASSRIISLKSDGTINTAFTVGSGFDFASTAITTANDGSGDIYVGGYFTSYNGTASNCIIRLKSDGTVKATFDTGSGFTGYVYTTASSNDGSGDVYVGGDITSYNGTVSNSLIHLTSTGAVSQTYSVNAGFDDEVTTIASTNDGSGNIYLGGSFGSYNGISSNRIISLKSDGTVNTAFAVGSGFNVINSTVYAITPANDSSGDIYVGGNFSSYNGTASNRIIRLKSDGTVNTTFNTGVGFDDIVETIIPVNDGSGDIYVGGWFTSYNGTSSSRIIRLKSDGTINTTFAVGSGFNAISSEVYAITPVNDGSGDIYVGGKFTSYNGTPSNRIIRLKSDGSIVATFAIGAGFNNTVKTILSANDGSGDIYVGGLFSSYNTTTASNRIIRLKNDGTVNSTFAVGAGFNNTINTISPVNDGSGDIYIGGRFSTYNESTTSNGILRLRNDGTINNAFIIGDGFLYGTIDAITPTNDSSGNFYVGGWFVSYQTTTATHIISLKADGSIY